MFSRLHAEWLLSFLHFGTGELWWVARPRAQASKGLQLAQTKLPIAPESPICKVLNMFLLAIERIICPQPLRYFSFLSRRQVQQ